MKRQELIQFISAFAAVLFEKFLPLQLNNKMIVSFTVGDIVVYGTMAFILYHNHRALRKMEKKNKLKIRYYKAGSNANYADKFSSLFTDEELKLLSFSESEIDLIRTQGPGIMMTEIVRRYTRLLD